MGWAYLLSLAHFSLSLTLRKIRSHESSSIDIVCLLLSYALLTQPKSSGTLSALPFLVKEREFYKLMQLRKSQGSAILGVFLQSALKVVFPSNRSRSPSESTTSVKDRGRGRPPDMELNVNLFDIGLTL
ncbi:hypothetical protein RIF29_48563 [Crotalaria pallida]|uniref:Uncharacterized protein n=1 Tax=Crotalaria pallida TaxID=3830 RepID=A0AAN9DPU1_CROPI